MDQTPKKIDNTEELNWVLNPWKQNWKRPTAAMAICVVVAALGGFAFSYPNFNPTPEEIAGSAHWGFQMLGWGVVGLLLMLSMTATIYLPVFYKLTKKGINVRFVATNSFREWSYYRNYYIHDTGVHMTTMAEPSRLDAFRGHFLQFAGNRDEVVEFIKREMAPYKKAETEDKSK